MSGGGAVREKGEESTLARLGYRDHPSLQHHRPSDREVLLDQPGDRSGPRSRCENSSVQRVHLILAGHERAVPQSDVTHRLRSDQGEEIRLRQRQQVGCGVRAGPMRASGQACQRTGGTHTEEPAPVHAHVRNTSVLTYRSPESMMISFTSSMPMPSIWCEPDGFPESTADSAGSTPATCNRGLCWRSACAAPWIEWAVPTHCTKALADD